MKQMQYWLISDTHFAHEKIIELCGRPTDYEERMFKALSRIPKDDVLIHLGDICIGKDAEVHKKFIAPLQCKKWLVKGNHDNKSNSWYLANGWDFVGYTLKDKYFNFKILFSHIPHVDNGFDLNIHGHLHNTGHRDPEGIFDEKHKLFAVEYTGYKPIELKQFLRSRYQPDDVFFKL